MDAIILAGGKGKRMEDDTPKAIIEARGKPIIFWQLDYLKDKVERIVLALGYKAEDVVKAVSKSYRVYKKIYFSFEYEPLGTAGALKKAFLKTQPIDAVVLNCDDITDINISELEKITDDRICRAHPILPFGLTEIGPDGYLIFIEKPRFEKYTSCGWYRLKMKEFYKNLPDKGMLEENVFPNIKILPYDHEGFWMTLNTRKDIEEFEKTKLPDALLA